MRSMISGTVIPVGGVGSVAPKPSCAAMGAGQTAAISTASVSVVNGNPKDKREANAGNDGRAEVWVGSVFGEKEIFIKVEIKPPRFTAYVSRRDFTKKGSGRWRRRAL